jgi:hypothetical protein
MAKAAATGVIAVIALTAAVLYFYHPPKAGSTLAANSSPTQTASTSSPSTPPVASASRDAVRQANLAAFLKAYQAAAASGVFPNNPPVVAVTLTDPSTGQNYVVATTKPTAIGQIWYQPGGSCGGQSTPAGTTGARQLALTMTLESGANYCLDTTINK